MARYEIIVKELSTGKELVREQANVVIAGLFGEDGARACGFPYCSPREAIAACETVKEWKFTTDDWENQKEEGKEKKLWKTE